MVHYGEITLKGKNRPVFEKRLRRNIRLALSSVEGVKLEPRQGRLIIEVEGDDKNSVMLALGNVFGISWFAEVERCESRYEQLVERALSIISHFSSSAKSFMVSVKRADKSYPMTSIELERAIGERIVREYGMKVSLNEPEVRLYIDIVDGEAILYTKKVRGLGGLPVGVSGRVIHLLSGGIDSPVAAWLLMKRGCMPIYLHFYMAPDYEYVIKSKIMEIIKVLSSYSYKATLILLPFSIYQLATIDLPSELEPVLFRRFMRVTAEKIAQLFNAFAISTGDSLAQAASQTINNISAMDFGCKLAILRPLLGYDKNEIVELAKRIGTYEYSIKEYKDCCSIITRHPKTKVSIDECLEYSERIGVEPLAERCIDSGKVIRYIAGNLKVINLNDLRQAMVSKRGSLVNLA